MNVDHAAEDRESPLGLLDGRFAQTLITLPSGAQVTLRTAGFGVGNVPVIVLLHGIGSGAASWVNVAVALSWEARVLAWDAPGYGDSTPLASTTPLATDYAERLHELLTAMKVNACVLVGHSLGALMAAAFASSPDGRVVQRLILISPAQGYGAADRTEARQKVLDDRLGSLLSLGINGMALQAPTRMLSATADESARAWVRWNTARLNPSGYTQAVQMLCHDDLDRYRDLSIPVHVYCGDADIVTPPGACREIAQRFDAVFALIPQAGHASPIEQPLSVARRIASAARLAPEDQPP